MRKTLAVTLTSEEYQAAYKTELIKRYATRNHIDHVSKILDFGCGVGLSIPSIQKIFKGSQIFATDTSKVSLQILHQKFPSISVISPDLETDERFDVIYLSTVLHHVTASERVPLLNKLKSLLSKNGCLFIVEHNTYNPLTLRIVANCEMDHDAELISIRALRDLLTRDCSLKIIESGFCSFFPQPLRKLAKFDRIFSALPLGGQYYMVAGK